jgi:hypothetical protein
MRTKHLTDFADVSDFISGIYNYCDRWCERCPFTARCRVYATENEETDDLASQDIRNAEFWRKLESVLRSTRAMIATWAEENGIDLNSIEAESEIAEHSRLVGEAKEHPLSVAARNYAASVNHWFETEVVELQSIDDRSDDEYENAQVINDAIAVIRWYQYQITVKIVRALTSQAEETAKDFDDMSQDSDGSSKVALVGIDRSSSAWRILQESCTGRKESITKVLLDLERLRQGLEQAFPDARDFIRPGFDEVWSDLVS